MLRTQLKKLNPEIWKLKAELSEPGLLIDNIEI